MSTGIDALYGILTVFLQDSTTGASQGLVSRASEAAASPLVNLLFGLFASLLVSLFFYWLGGRSSKQQLKDLKEYISGLIPYEKRLDEALKALEGKMVEGEGRIVVDRDENESPIRVRIAPTQVIKVQPIELEAAVGTVNVEIGSPPTPPQSVSKDMTLRWGTEANNDEREARDGAES